MKAARLAAGLALALAALPNAANAAKRTPAAPANPSALVAAEIAFNRAARDTGQWTAFRAFAAADAVMFVPQPVNALSWLKGRADPPRAVQWQPHKVWISCDGTLGATLGAWQRANGRQGYFTTVWARQADGSYRWVMDQGDLVATPLSPPDMIEARVASCETPAPALLGAAPTGPGRLLGGRSRDGTLGWSVRVDPRCGRTVRLHMFQGAGIGSEVMLGTVDAPENAAGAPAVSCGE